MTVPETPDILAMPTPPKQAVALIIIIFFTAIAFIAFSLRVWTRLRVTRQWGLGTLHPRPWASWFLLAGNLSGCADLCCV